MENQVKFLIDTYGKDDQRTEAWHLKRGEMLTASEISKTTKEASPAARHELIVNKLTPREPGQFMTARALIWGTQFEPMAKQIYGKMFGVQIVDTTCIPHPRHSFLGASPDGIQITEDVTNPRYGRLVEFKCPISRKIDESLPIPQQYVDQMQLQMECTQLNVCDYAEFQFKQMNYTEWMDTDVPHKSAFIVSEDGKTVLYRDVDDTRTIGEWKQAVISPDDEGHWMFVFWALLKTRFVTVEKDTEWLNRNLPFFESTWADIQKHREAGTMPDHPREKNTLVL
jgi:putative phage-type endonuclease